MSKKLADKTATVDDDDDKFVVDVDDVDDVDEDADDVDEDDKDVDDIDDDDDDDDDPSKVRVVDYSDKSIAVLGDTRDYGKYFSDLRVPDAKNPDKEKKGLFNRYLTDPKSKNKTPGWIFDKAGVKEVKKLVRQINAGELETNPIDRKKTPSKSPAKSPVKKAKSPAKKAAPVKTPAGRKSVAVRKVPTTLTVTYTVPNLVVGMKGDAVFEDGVNKFVVTKLVKSKSGHQDMAEVMWTDDDLKDDEKGPFVLAVVAGEWQLIGVSEDHTIKLKM